jgi:hypothetical protein
MKDLLHQFNVVATAIGYASIAATLLLVAAAHISSVREKRWRRRHGRRPEMVSLEWHKFDAYDDGVRHQGWN